MTGRKTPNVDRNVVSEVQSDGTVTQGESSSTVEAGRLSPLSLQNEKGKKKKKKNQHLIIIQSE